MLRQPAIVATMRDSLLEYAEVRKVKKVNVMRFVWTNSVGTRPAQRRRSFRISTERSGAIAVWDFEIGQIC